MILLCCVLLYAWTFFLTAKNTSRQAHKPRKPKHHSVWVKRNKESLSKTGVEGFILKGATLDDFLTAIRSAKRGGVHSPPLTKSQISKIIKQAIAKRKRNAKTQRRS